MVEETYSTANGYEHDAQVVYGDTDSVFVKFGCESISKVREQATRHYSGHYDSTGYLTDPSMAAVFLFFFVFFVLHQLQWLGNGAGPRSGRDDFQDVLTSHQTGVRESVLSAPPHHQKTLRWCEIRQR